MMIIQRKHGDIPLKCIEVEQPPIDESLPWKQYRQRMLEDVEQIPLTIVRNGKTYSSVDAFLKRREGSLAIWSAIYCNKPDSYDVNNKPAFVMDLIQKAHSKTKP